MKRTMGGAALLAAVVALAPMQSDAQVGPRAGRGQAFGARGGGVEMILRQRERLELTESQVTQLDRIRQEAVQHQTAQRAELAELTSKVRAGQVEVAEFREQAQARRDAAAEFQKQQRERVEGILTDAQKEQLQDWAGQARAFQRGRMSAMRGGPGFAPGAWGAPGARFQRGAAPGGRQRWAPMPQGWRGMRRGPGMGMGFGPPADTLPR